MDNKNAPKLATKTELSNADFKCVLIDISSANISNNIPEKNAIYFTLKPMINSIPKVISNVVAIIPSVFAIISEAPKFSSLV